MTDLNKGERILREREVCERLGISRSTLWRQIAAGDFRRPLKIGARAVGWPSSWVDARIADLIAHQQ